MLDKVFSVLASMVVVAGVTTAVLPGRETGAIVREGGTAGAKIFNAIIGRG